MAVLNARPVTKTPPRGAPIVRAERRIESLEDRVAALEEENRKLVEENERLKAENERLSEMYKELSNRLLTAEKAIVEIAERIWSR